MAGPTRQKPIGVVVRRPDWTYSEPDRTDTHYLGRDERVLVVNRGFPEQHFSIDPPRRFHPNHLTARWSRTLMKGQRHGWEDTNEPSEYRGDVLGTFNVRRLGRLDAKTHILFEHKGKWLKGEVQPWVDTRAMRKAEERAEARVESKDRKRRNRHLRIPTAWDRLLADDE